MMITALTSRQWEALIATTNTRADIEKLEDELGADLSEEGARFDARHAITRILEPWFAQNAYHDVAALLDGHGVCWGPYQSFRQLVEEDPRVDPDHNPVWSVIDQLGVGSYPAPGTPLTFSAVLRAAPKPAPLLGSDTVAVLTDIVGLTGDEIENLRKEAIV